MKGYHALVKSERWKRNNGADFVFFDPHPGFTDGTSDKAFKKLMCQTSKDSMHIVVERGQVNICPVGLITVSGGRHPWRLTSVMEITSHCQAVSPAEKVIKSAAHLPEADHYAVHTGLF